MSYRLARFSLFCFIALSTATVYASSDIYKCIDRVGHTSYGDRPCPVELMSGDSPAHRVWYQMRSMISEGLRVHALLGPDIYSIRSCMDESERYNRKLFQLNGSLSSLSEDKFSNMYTAMDYLKECGECRASAPNYCQRALKSLKQETQKLITSWP